MYHWDPYLRSAWRNCTHEYNIILETGLAVS